MNERLLVIQAPDSPIIGINTIPEIKVATNPMDAAIVFNWNFPMPEK